MCAVDESNDHMLSVWDWAKESKVVDGKVGCLCSSPLLGVPLWDWLELSS